MDKLNLSAPTIPVFWVSVALAVLALIGHFASAGLPHDPRVLDRDPSLRGAADRQPVQGTVAAKQPTWALDPRNT
jgi:hypothetical protein